jgi:hypothetical protein
VTLVGLWLIPIAISYFVGAHRFQVVWLAFSLATAWHVQLARKIPLQASTPRYAELVASRVAR